MELSVEPYYVHDLQRSNDHLIDLGEPAEIEQQKPTEIAEVDGKEQVNVEKRQPSRQSSSRMVDYHNVDNDESTELLGERPTERLRVTIADVLRKFACGGGVSDPAGMQLPIDVDLQRHAYKWPRRSSKFLLRVPDNLRQANPEAFRPRLFHFGPYAAHFFQQNLEKDGTQSTSRCSPVPDNVDTRLSSPPVPDNADSRVKVIMVEDLVGKKLFFSLVQKILQAQEHWEVLGKTKDLYTQLEKPHLMDLNVIPAETLARLFATSASIILSSLILYGCSGDMAVEVRIRHQALGSQSLTIRHPVINQYYAILDAVMIMDNQIPILLLELACETFCGSEDRIYDVVFETGHELNNLYPGGDSPVNDIEMQKRVRRLLVYMLRKCLKFVSPFYVANDGASNMWRARDLRRTRSWIAQNHDKTLIAYVYDSLVGRLNDDEGENQMTRSTTDVADDGCCRTMSASELQRWGVTFRASPSGSFRGIKLEDSITYTELTLPIITIQETTMPFLCNLMAYELTTKLEAVGRLQHVCSYVLFLKYLISTEEDLEVLMEAGVLKNDMARSNGRVFVVEMLDKLVVESRSMLVDLTPEHMEMVEKLWKACRRRWWWPCWASLRSLWREKMISGGAAALLLVLTLLQTIYTIHNAGHP